MSSLTAVKSESLREQVVQALEEALASGELAPGQLLSVPVLARHFDVSATPVREALLKLASRGIVEPVRNRGFRVTRMTRRDLDEHVELRLLVEPPMVAQATPRIDADAVAELRVLVERERLAARAGDRAALLEHDRAIHLGLMARCGNAPAAELIGSLYDEARLRGILRAAPARTLVELARGDGELVELVAAERAEAAADAVRAQLGALRDAGAAAIAAAP